MALGFVRKLLPSWHSEEWQAEAAPGTGTVTNVTGTAPIHVINNTTTPVVSHDDSGSGGGSAGDSTHVFAAAVEVKGHITTFSNVAIKFAYPLTFSANGVQAWIGGDPVWLAAANADQWVNEQGYPYFGALAATHVAIEIDVQDFTPVGGTMQLTFEIYVNGAATGDSILVVGTGLSGNIFALAVPFGQRVGVKASMTGTAASGSIRAKATVTMTTE